MSETIKPCPRCRGKVRLMAIAGAPFSPTYEVDLDKIDENSDDICYIHCPTCGANWHIEIRENSTPLQTIRAWNLRAEPSGKAEPLTIEELRQMDGQPVFVVNLNNRNNSRWEIIKGTNEPNALDFFSFRDSIYFIRSYGKTWLAYRRRPESEEK